jgi:hypothetical protein
MSEIDPNVPPVGEEIHLPGPSILPFVNALGITCLVISTTLGLPFLIVGAILFLYSTIRWLLDVRRDVAALPEDHSQGH